MAARSKSTDVHEELTNSRRRSRAQDEIPCPVVYSSDQVAHDNWNHMFLKSLSQGLTLRQYDTPPKDILDLGCGSGLWVMDAAQQWPTSRFVGYDCLRIQPDLNIVASQPGLEDLGKRVQWVHGNFLDPLPFKANSFDFVRICGIGLGVPEDEWQSLLQEVARVLKPGAFVEIIEEDLIFPASGDSIKETGTPPSTRRLRLLLEPISTEQNSITATSRTSNTSMKSPSVIASTLARFQTDSPQQPAESTRSSSPLPRPTISELLDPRDHTLLKAAWDEMLHERFLAPGLLSVLHFYFSAEFEEVQSHPTIRILLPPNSQMTFNTDDFSNNRTRSTSISNTLEGITVAISQAPDTPRPSIHWNSFDHILEGYGPRHDAQRTGPVITTSWATMHLSKAFSTVQGCKEAIWHQYKELLTSDENKLDEQELYKEFLASWAHWESDMRDRIGMRYQMQSDLSWSASVPTDPPDWKAWRDRVGYLDGVDDAVPQIGNDTCRALRGFVGRKPFHQDTQTP